MQHHERSSLERAIVSDERQAASAEPGAWQLNPVVLTFMFLLIGAAFGAGIHQTGEYKSIAWLFFLGFGALVSHQMRGFDAPIVALKRVQRERDDMQTALDTALGEIDRIAATGRALAQDNTALRIEAEAGRAFAVEVIALRRELETTQAMAAQTSKLLDRFWSDEPTTIYADPYTGKTEVLEV